MERLEFDKNGQLQSLEAAIHINRYVLAKQFCKDKNVLDIACGQGYGSYLMGHKWGANSVAGVDISSEAIDAANKYFKNGNVNFYCHPAETITELFAPQSFDVIISLETIEHITDPILFLQVLKQLIKPDGVIILSCPNDHWYFPEDSQCNPFHIRKYTFDEFKNTAESVLGHADTYMLGTPVAGFMNFVMEDPLVGRLNANQLAMLEARAVCAEFVPSDCKISPEVVSYFVGIWGCNEVKTTAAFYPHSMDHEDLEMLRKEVTLGKDDIWNKSQMIKELEIENRHTSLKLAAIKAENDYIREEKNKLANELQHVNNLLQMKTDERIIREVKAILKKVYSKIK